MKPLFAALALAMLLSGPALAAGHARRLPDSVIQQPPIQIHSYADAEARIDQLALVARYWLQRIVPTSAVGTSDGPANDHAVDAMSDLLHVADEATKALGLTKEQHDALEARANAAYDGI